MIRRRRLILVGFAALALLTGCGYHQLADRDTEFAHDLRSPPIGYHAAAAETLGETSHANNAGLQERRRQFIEDMIAQGIFYKIETPGHLPRLWVTVLFRSLGYETKQEFVNVVYAYYVTANPDSDIVVLYDSQSGKQIGRYAPVYGGLDLD